jgi:hypothetical protein
MNTKPSMRALTASELISLWERGAGSASAARGLLLLATGAGEMPAGVTGHVPVGQRDAWLLELRERTFGPDLSCLAACPACGEDLECRLNTADLRVAEASGDSPDTGWPLRVGEHEITFRLPTAGDLLTLLSEAEVSENRLRLLNNCLLSARREGQAIAAEELPDSVAEAVSARMAELDPQADLRLRLDCPECGHQWEAPFDIVSFFWKEIHAAATRLLREVHELASAYGWREADILALTPPRRQAYLELIRG